VEQRDKVQQPCRGSDLMTTGASFDLYQNPRWRPATILKNGKSQKPDICLRCLHKFFNKTANIIYKKLQAIYLMLYKRYKTAKNQKV